MKVLPFALTQRQQNDFQIHCLLLFLTHAGKSVWKTEEPGCLSEKTLIEEYLEPNDIFAKNIKMDAKKNIAYIEIDTSRTMISDFYTWDEAIQKPSKPECWRRFYFIQDKEGLSWWSPKGFLEAEIQGMETLDELFLSLKSSHI